MKILLKIYCLLFICSTCWTQVSNEHKLSAWQIESSWHLGTVLKHRDFFRPEITEPTYIYELTFKKQTNANALWAALYNCPLYGFSLSYIDIGDKETLGQAIGVLPFINFRRRYKHINFNIKIGVGLAYFTKTFNAVNNYANNAIGGHFTNYTRFEFGFNSALSQRLDLDINMGLTHASNGNTEQPNLGINFIAGKIGLSYKFNDNYVPLEKRKVAFPKKISLSIMAGLGFNSVGIENGPNYPVYTNSFFIEKKHSLKGAITLGGDFEYYESVKRILVISENSDSKRFLAATKWAILTGYHFLFPNFGLHAQVGIYAYNPHVKRGDVVVKLNAYYYFKNQYVPQKVNPFIGANLKSHYFSADYVQFVLGLKF